MFSQFSNLYELSCRLMNSMGLDPISEMKERSEGSTSKKDIYDYRMSQNVQSEDDVINLLCNVLDQTVHFNDLHQVDILKIFPY